MNVGDPYGDELVVFEGSQTLPLFLVYTTEFGGGQVASTATDKRPSNEATASKGWNFPNQGFGEEEVESGVIGGTDTSQGEILIFD